MALGLGREGLHQPHHDQPADDRHQDHERPPGARRIELVGVVEETEFPQEQNVVDDSDHVAEHHRADRRDHADEEGQNDEDGQ